MEALQSLLRGQPFQALTMKSVAAKVGIGDGYQLSKQFRRRFGVSPMSRTGRGPGHGADSRNHAVRYRLTGWRWSRR
ncbi:MAG: AraC family transcriptional regulator [Verrucomicrobiaceae bacterium]|nr:MAG: AraC family transcriptional regulator [Verrucomicrobiaceae bacterium]